MTTTPSAGRPALAGAHRGLWMLMAAGVHALGLVLVLDRMPWQALLAVFLPASLLVGSCALSLEAVTREELSLGRSVRIGTAFGLAVLAGVGLASALSWPGLLLLAAVYATAPGTAARLRWLLDVEERPAATWDPDSPPVDEPPAEQPAGAPHGSLDVPSHLSDQDLCLAWESSTLALRQCRSVEARVGIVMARQACIDELERRQPDALHQWLAAGADPDVSPARFLSR